jgi:hypothetical protein
MAPSADDMTVLARHLGLKVFAHRRTSRSHRTDGLFAAVQRAPLLIGFVSP